jgi:hypothetical protein
MFNQNELETELSDGKDPGYKPPDSSVQKYKTCIRWNLPPEFIRGVNASI